MRRNRRLLITTLAAAMIAAMPALGQDKPAVALPEGVKAVWDLGKAYRESTPTRERVCINGLWQWQPVKERSDRPPAENWGYFKVPGPWATSWGRARNRRFTIRIRRGRASI